MDPNTVSILTMIGIWVLVVILLVGLLTRRI